MVRGNRKPPVLRTSSSYADLWGEDSVNYKQYLKDRSAALDKRLTSPNRFQTISEREDHSDLSLEAIKAQCKGRYFIQHRGCSLLKTPGDMVIFHELFWRLRPATVIELGTFTGGSAVWMADMLLLMEIDAAVYSMDIDLSNVEERVKEIKQANVHFMEGNSYEIEKTFTEKMLQSLPHPWLVVEDSHTNIYGILEYFGSYMKSGDYFIIEDLHPNLPSRLGCGAIYDEKFVPASLQVLENSGLKEFLTEHVDKFAVDSFYTDFFGYNGTWNIHGYICKI